MHSSNPNIAGNLSFSVKIMLVADLAFAAKPS